MTGSLYSTPIKSPPTTKVSTPTLIRVAVPTPLRRAFDYILPEEEQGSSLIGCRVLVPFGTRKLIGWVLDENVKPEIELSKLKSIAGRIDQSPLLPPTLMRLLVWASDYYFHPIGEVFETAVPALLRQGKSLHDLEDFYWHLTPLGQTITANTIKRAPKQLLALELLAKKPHASSDLKQSGIQSTILQSMAKKGWCEKKPLKAEPKPPSNQPPDLQLTEEQAHAVLAIQTANATFQTFALEGITGSGKTVVYMAAIAECLKQQKQALVLVPEIGLTPQTLARFTSVFPDVDITVIHSNLTDRERALAWSKARHNMSTIVIGTRSAVFTPLANPGIFIVDEEHDLSYKQQDHFRYCARDILIRRAQLEKCPIVVGSATLSLETYHNVQQKKYQWLPLTTRYGQGSLPTITTLDIRHQKLSAGLSAQLIEGIRETLAQKKQVMLFINRRGFAPVLFCVHCQWQQLCPFCDAKMIVHLFDNELRCHHCDHKIKMPSQCPSCHAEDLQPVGIGTQRLEAELQKVFPEASLTRLDKDATAKKNELQQKLEMIHQGEVDIIIGTQMLAKGHHFSNLALVAIVNVDQALFSADFRAIERLAQLLTQVAGRAGRETAGSQVFLQTCLPHHPQMTTLIQKGYQTFLENEYEERRLSQLPPFKYQAMFRAESTNSEAAEMFLNNAKQVSPGSNPTFHLLGPVLSPMEKKQGRYRWQLLLQAEDRRTLHVACWQILAVLEIVPKRNIRWSIDIDPLDIL